MCNFCSAPATKELNIQEEVIPLCERCYNFAKICDNCGKLKVYGLNLTYSRDTGFICESCAINFKHCHKCGTKHNNDNELCSQCNEKWFKCTDCGTFKTKARSLINIIEYLSLKDHLSSRNVCTKCCSDYTQERLEVHTCACGAYYTGNDPYCPNCMAHSFTCGCCSNIRIGASTLFNETLYCTRCSSQFLSECTECNTLCHTQDLKNNICPVCVPLVKECSRCGKWGKLHEPIDDISLCKECYRYIVNNCAICEKLHYDLLDGICPDCRFEYGIDEIRNYTTKMPIRLKGKAHQPHYGIENEVSLKLSLPRDVGIAFMAKRQHGSNCIYKSDSSVLNGFECVYRPMTLDEILKYTFPFDKKIFVKDASCGMHIHINKSAFTTFHMYKFFKFLTEYVRWVEFIAERKLNEYCQINHDSCTELAKTKRTYGRDMINLKNAKTVELRMFAGTTSDKQLKKNVEFVDALYYWTKNNSTKKSLNKEDFINWVMTQKYKHLKEFLKGLN